MTDDFKSLKNLGRTISKNPSDLIIQHWKDSAEIKRRSLDKNLISKQSRLSRVGWWQIAAALVAGILIGKFLLQSNPQLFSTMAKNSTDDETFEYIYTNN